MWRASTVLHAPDDTGQPFSCQATKKQLQRISNKLSLNKADDMLLVLLTSWRSKDPMLLQRLLASNLEAAGGASIRCALIKKQFPHLPSKEFCCKCYLHCTCTLQ